jgi:hypothetical protein
MKGSLPGCVTLKYQVILLNTSDTDVYAQDLARSSTCPNPRAGWNADVVLTEAFGADVRRQGFEDRYPRGLGSTQWDRGVQEETIDCIPDFR